MELLLGIDIGTSSCKIDAFDSNGNSIMHESHTYKIHKPHMNWAEQDPEDWWLAVCSLLKKMTAFLYGKGHTIVGIGIDGQGWSMVPIDKMGTVLHNSPIWMDHRAQDICTRFKQEIGEDNIFAISGNPMEPTYSLPKLLWLKEHKPEIYEKTDKVLQASSYIVYKLTQSITQDISQGYALQCFDIKNGKWHDDLIKAFGISRSYLPEIVNSDEIVGHITQDASVRTGLKTGIPVVAGGLDAACGTLGVGVFQHGDVQEQGGQAEGMSICLDSCIADPKLILGFHVVPGKWLLQGGTVGGGGVHDWVKNNICLSDEHITSNDNIYQQMDSLAQTIPPGSDGVVFLPYMAGERSPIWDPYAKAVYYGLDYSKTKGHLIRATQEAVAFSLKHNLDHAERSGAKVDILYAMGGSANSSFWTQMKADITGKKIIVSASDSATTLGAAILAGIAIGMYKNYNDAKNQTFKVQKEYIPNKEHYSDYEKSYVKYLQLYKTLNKFMYEYA